MATQKTAKTSPSWSDVKAKLAELDRNELIAILQALYSTGQDNKFFLHTRFNLGEDPLEPFKNTITHWINPPNLRNPISISKAKRAISYYKKALGQPEGLAELAVHYCEEAFSLLSNCSVDDESYYNAIARMFEQALKHIQALTKQQQTPFLKRLGPLRQLGHEVGWGLGDDLDELWQDAGLSKA